MDYINEHFYWVRTGESWHPAQYCDNGSFFVIGSEQMITTKSLMKLGKRLYFHKTNQNKKTSAAYAANRALIKFHILSIGRARQCRTPNLFIANANKLNVNGHTLLFMGV